MANLLNSVNLLKLAMSVIPPRDVQFIAYKSSTINAYGEVVCTYESPITLKAVVIEDNNSVYEQFGLSPQKQHRTVYVNIQVKATADQTATDMFFFDGHYWRVITTTDWSVYNGWSSCIVSQLQQEEVPPINETPEQPTEEENEVKDGE